MPVTKGQCVRVNYRGTLQDGTEFDSSYGRHPLEFTVGEGSVIPGFEEAVEGMDIGDRKTVTIEPEQAYGDHHDEAVQEVPRSLFEEEPASGEIVSLIAPDGSEVMASVVTVGDDNVKLDFNHPLAGHQLTFEVELVSIC